MKKMHGIITPIVTPFDKKGNIDPEVLEHLISYLISKKIDSVYPNGTTGEMLKMTIKERKFVAEETMKSAAGKIGVFVQVGAPTTSETIELARHAVEIGVDGIGVVTPQFFGVSAREMERFYLDVSSKVPSDFPVYIYNIPQCAANDITPEVVDSILRKTKNIVGIKYSGSDMIRLNNYLACNGGLFDVVIGQDRLFLAGMTMGCVGTVSGCSQCGPDAFVETYKEFLLGNLQTAMEAQRRAIELCEIVKAGTNMAWFKAALEFNEVGRSYMRRPALDLFEEERQSLFNDLGKYKEKYDYL